MSDEKRTSNPRCEECKEPFVPHEDEKVCADCVIDKAMARGVRERGAARRIPGAPRSSEAKVDTRCWCDQPGMLHSFPHAPGSPGCVQRPNEPTGEWAGRDPRDVERAKELGKTFGLNVVRQGVLIEHFDEVRRQAQRETPTQEAKTLNDWPNMPAWSCPNHDDTPLPEDDQINAVHPATCDNPRFDLYAEAMRLVGARRSKGELVMLVHWLLCRIEGI